MPEDWIRRNAQSRSQMKEDKETGNAKSNKQKQSALNKLSTRPVLAYTKQTNNWIRRDPPRISDFFMRSSFGMARSEPVTESPLADGFSGAESLLLYRILLLQLVHWCVQLSTTRSCRGYEG